jgi:protoporphyrinogen oxidase
MNKIIIIFLYQKIKNMNRRCFVHLSALALAGLASCDIKKSDDNIRIKFPIKVQSNRQNGHKLRVASDWSIAKKIESEYLIVGGGIAGLSAAYQLRQKDFYLCELSETLGGTASAVKWGKTSICQGAHYELSYPDYFGEEALKVLSEVGIVKYHSLSNRWNFVDSQYLIDDEQEAMSIYQNKERDGVLPDSQAVKQFFEQSRPYLGKLMAPSRLIDKSLHHFNGESFLNYLQRTVKLDETTRQAMNYQMIDDFGGGLHEVSALAGLYYYLSRPYLEEDNPFQLFSPPQGNFYFIEKLLSKVPSEQVSTQKLVSKIEPQKKGFKVEILDLASQKKIILNTKKIVYAGQKHALKHVFSEDAKLFAKNRYAPWAVISFIVKKEILPIESYWQNEVIDASDYFLGFVDSDTQYLPSTEYRVLTAYFCFPPEMREEMVTLEQNPKPLIEKTLIQIANYFQIDAQKLANHTIQAMLKIMGHAMSIPSPEYLLKDQNQHRSHTDLVYAGVDNHRLPLLLEAIDSGIQAVKQW